MSQRPETGHGSFQSYTVGFVSSLILTGAAYLMVVNHLFGGWTLIFAIMALAIAQLLVQLLFFLHMGRESRPRWNQAVFLFMLLVVFILVAGSLWIMNNLNYHHDHLSPAQTDNFITKDEGFQN
jgi:cytochrome o ubiquinol oxidase operon protein cyoD